jgi:hypothetical protein
VAAGAWLQVLRRYILVVALTSLAWEFAHLPLCTVWWEGNFGAAAFAAAHCTGGDLLIVASSLLLALLLFGASAWPERGFARVAAATILFGVGCTAFSGWLNTEVRGSRRYTELMPTLPLLGTGLSPLGQCMVIPLAAFWRARRPAAYP